MRPSSLSPNRTGVVAASAARSLPAAEPDAQFQRALAAAAAILEKPNALAKSLALIGAPVDAFFAGIPKLLGSDLRQWVDLALLKCLETAITSLRGPTPRWRGRWLSTIVTGVAGGIGGFFGPIALPVELVVTSILLFRAIGAIAVEEGEDLSRPDAWLACMEVIALGTMRFEPGTRQDYYGSRASLTAMSDPETVRLLREHLGEASTLVMTRVTGDILVRVVLVLTEVASSGTVPLVGGMTGFTVAAVFMDHFQRIARGHFTVRRLERRFGRDVVRRAYADVVAAL